MTLDENTFSADGAPSSSEPNEAAPAGQRVAKLMARAGLCSRREAETWIVAGRVHVNGEKLTTPARDIGASDIVLVDGVPLPTPERTRLFLFHKPRGLVTSERDPEGRATVADFLRTTWPDGPRTVTVGRLDINTEGLLLLTNDGGLARLLELPQTGWVRRYRVRAKGQTDQAQLDTLKDGVTVDGVDYAGITATLDRTQGANTWLTMSLREGKNREIKRVLEPLGLEVNRLIRLSFGPFQLLDLAEGAVEEVRPRVLRDQLGETLMKRAGVVLVDCEQDSQPKRSRATNGSGSRDTLRPNKDEHSRSVSSKPASGRPDRFNSPGGAGRSLIRRKPDRQAEEAAALSENRSRPQRSVRKHVSTLRSAGASEAATGPRRRIERTDTRDRRDRAVTVERLLTPKPAKTLARATGKATTTREHHLSPSAAAKRIRMERSGGQHGDQIATERRGDSRQHRPDRSSSAPKAVDRASSKTDKRKAVSRPHATAADNKRPVPHTRESDPSVTPNRKRRGGTSSYKHQEGSPQKRYEERGKASKRTARDPGFDRKTEPMPNKGERGGAKQTREGVKRLGSGTKRTEGASRKGPPSRHGRGQDRPSGGKPRH